ncbi:hypothetical protein BN13_80053 [Nostocoides jenkinsii Ben 74]|jgi:hypothetical protein|uniref:Uncharacterized protein n=1 Tax=Nostocoides jenkinsii Ben 74 TaxID=1193518 RepID=A0A077MDF2_9MICO|nr:hypothetical protein BN13_80053 [Tetrasphaera jenkinsii Ben 74]
MWSDCAPPTRIDADGDQFWEVDGQPHRDNGLPAVMRADGTTEYWVHGVRQPPPAIRV